MSGIAESVTRWFKELAPGDWVGIAEVAVGIIFALGGAVAAALKFWWYRSGNILKRLYLGAAAPSIADTDLEPKAQLAGVLKRAVKHPQFWRRATGTRVTLAEEREVFRACLRDRCEEDGIDLGGATFNLLVDEFYEEVTARRQRSSDETIARWTDTWLADRREDPPRPPAITPPEAAFRPGPTLVTLVSTDVENSGERWERMGIQFQAILDQHNEVLRQALAAAGGTEVKQQGDGFLLAFDRPSAAVEFAARAQSALAAQAWPDAVGELHVRMGIHTGEALLSEGPEGRPDYSGPAVSRAAQIGDAAHGGQVLLSSAALNLVQNELPEGASVQSLGSHRLQGLPQAEQIHQLVYAGMPREDHREEQLDRQSSGVPIAGLTRIGTKSTVAVPRSEVQDCPVAGTVMRKRCPSIGVDSP